MLVYLRRWWFCPHSVSRLHSIARKCHCRIDLDAVVIGTLVLRTRHHALNVLIVLVPINRVPHLLVITKRWLDGSCGCRRGFPSVGHLHHIPVLLKAIFRLRRRSDLIRVRFSFILSSCRALIIWCRRGKQARGVPRPHNHWR